MKKLKDERIAELIMLTENKIILAYKEHNDTPNLEDYKHLINKIKTINDITDEKEIIKELQYLSCSSNFWSGVTPLMQAYEERLGRHHFLTIFNN